MGLIDVVRKLTGPVMPVGSSEEDRDRLANLGSMTHVIDKLVSEVARVALFGNDYRASVKLAGKQAQEFLSDLHHSLSEGE